MDKNKAAYKLEGLPHIYYTNLDRSEARRKYMEDQFKYWNITDYTRISGYDGTVSDLSEILKGRYPDMMGPTDVGCCTSHLKAIKHWLETTDDQVAIMMEDDCDLRPISYWGFTWKDFYASLPFDWDVVQLAVINPGSVYIKLHKRFVNDFSTACYLINRRHAEKIMHYTDRGTDKWKLDYKAKPRCNSEHLIYDSGNTYAIPLLLYSAPEHPSMIQTKEHIDAFHVPSRDGLWNFWTTQSNKISDWKDFFDYDPYLGRLPPMPEQAGA
jgi:hypothetical protein